MLDQVFGEKYRVVRVLGRGGMSTVYEAQHVQLGQRVALKVLNADGGAGARGFERVLLEARAAARLGSEHVVRVFDVGTTPDGQPFVVMEKLEGRDLARELAARGSFPVADAVGLVLQACEAIAEAHGAGIVHRDLKPSNLFVVIRPDGLPAVKVLDFGLVHPVATDPAAPRSAAGSPGYASPEQLGTQDDVDGRADVWGLGVVLYELVSGRRAFEASTLSDGLFAVVSKPAPSLVSPRGPLPPGFEDVVRRCLATDREARFRSIVELADALAPFASPTFARYARRVHEIAARSNRPSERAMRVPPTDPDAATTGRLSRTGPGESGVVDPGSQTDSSAPGGASPLVVAQIVSPGRAAIRFGVVAVCVAAVVGLVVAFRPPDERSAGAASALPSASLAVVAAQPSAAGSVALLPPLPPPATGDSATPASGTTAAVAPPAKAAAVRSAAAHGARPPSTTTTPKAAGAAAPPAAQRPGGSSNDPMTYR